MKKLILAGLTAATLGLGMAAMTTPAQAQFFFHVGPTWHPGWHPGWHRPYGGAHWTCRWVSKRHHGQWVQVRRCGWR